MKKKNRISIRLLIIIPVIVLGIMSIISNVVAVRNLKKVNNSANMITESCMTSIEEIAKISTITQDLHTLALSHIVAVDFDTMIDIVNKIKQQQSELDLLLENYQQFVTDDIVDDYQMLIEYYDSMKRSLILVVGNSANMKTTEAYRLANEELGVQASKIKTCLEAFNENSSIQSSRAKTGLNEIYLSSITSNILTIVFSLIAIFIAMYVATKKVVHPILRAQKDIQGILQDIEKGEGDLTKRVQISGDDEIADLAYGLNAFLDKLQNIMCTIIENCRRMEVVVVQVQDSVCASNNSASDLSAVTEELSATMQEVGNSAAKINQSACSVKTEVELMAQQSLDINSYSKDMKAQAEEMETSAKQNLEETATKINEILESLNQALADSESVGQVNSLTNDILNIASQTNLLALNASIEAARAGDAGRGFAVVADEIRQLADSSRQNANHIQEINRIVTSAVHNLSEQSQQLIQYLTEAIMPEFEVFVKSGEQYKKKATLVESIVEEFTEKTNCLQTSVDEIAEAIGTITMAIEEGVTGVGAAADSTQLLVVDMENIANQMNENKEISNQLKKETEIFQNM